MSKYCPYTDSQVVYLQCQECEEKICDGGWFFCLVVGSRSFQDYNMMCEKLDTLLANQQDIVIVSGGARGADALAERYAHKRGYELIVVPAQWDEYGKQAGYIRNSKMHSLIARYPKRGCVAFWDGKSRGTQHNFELAKKHDTPMRVVRF